MEQIWKDFRSSSSHEWVDLMNNFREETRKPNPNWWVWTTCSCFYREGVRRQIQIVFSEILISRGIHPWQILSTEPPEKWNTVSLDGQKEIAKVYCAQLMYIVKKSLEQIDKPL